MENLKLGIDVGGTYIKSGLIDENYSIIDKMLIPTNKKDGYIGFLNKIVQIVHKYDDYEIEKIGICIPGVIDDKEGISIFSGNLGWENFRIKSEIENLIGKSVSIKNDVYAALIGEKKLGIGKKYKDWVLLTLGTGIGGGIVSDNKIIGGNMGKGGEFGHMTIVCGGKKCTCGRMGCFEAYASAAALASKGYDTVMQYKGHTTLKSKIDNCKKIDPKDIFKAYLDRDLCGQKIINEYIYYLGEGLLNICNIIRPEAIVLGGGLSEQKELVVLLNDYIEKNNYGYYGMPKVIIEKAFLGNNAGMIGAILGD